LKAERDLLRRAREHRIGRRRTLDQHRMGVRASAALRR
jgi:hypothetical protein